MDTACGASSKENKNNTNSWKCIEVHGTPFVAEIIHASKSQSDLGGNLCGTQCGSIVATACAYSEHIQVLLWNQDLLDRIIDQGNDRHVENPKKDDRGYVDVRDCAGDYEIDGSIYKLECRDFGVGRPKNCGGDLETLKDVEVVIQEIVDLQIIASVVYNTYTFAIFCDEQSVYLFNCHGCSEDGIPSPDGTASVIRMDRNVAASGIARILVDNYSPSTSQTSTPENWTFQFSSVEVCKSGKSKTDQREQNELDFI